MCGIAGLFYFDRDRAVHREDVVGMADQIKHRGPDAEGIYTKNNIGLSHRRLSIIDISSGQQPMATTDDRMVIVFNGEIYNHHLLKKQLSSKGHHFKTNSDTEVILHSFAEWGENCVDFLRGMYAFAIWDQHRQQLFCARDRVGIKPFYYFLSDDCFAFASELKSLLTLKNVKRDIDYESIDAYFTLGYIPSPYSAFKSIKKLPAGHKITIRDHTLTLSKFWELTASPYSENQIDEKEASEKLLKKIVESVDCHLMSEVPLGAFLSGGVDSTSVVAAMHQLDIKNLSTITIGFNEKEFDESSIAKATSEFYATSHSSYTAQIDISETLQKLVCAFDEPLADASAVPTYHVCKLARQNVTVALSGDGGDELFAGYNWYPTLLSQQLVNQKIPSILRSMGSTLLHQLPSNLRGLERCKSVLADEFNAYLYLRSVFSRQEKKNLYSPDFHQKTKENQIFSEMENQFLKTARMTPLRRLQYIDMKYYMVDDILTKVDKMSMMHSLEVRVPLLDNELIDFAWSLPTHLKLHENQRKYIFKKAVQSILPPSILNLPKKGFTPPVASWLKGDLKDVLEDTLFSSKSISRGYFNLRELRSLKSFLDHPTRFSRTTEERLWTIMMFELWHRKWMDQG